MPLNFALLDPPEKSFEDLMRLEEVTDIELPPSCRCFQSTMKPFQPVAAPGAFGGHVLGQAAYAGAQTVGPTYICHNFHGYFILPGKSHVPFIYLVETLRNGRSYSTRSIKVYQVEEDDLANFKFDTKYLCFHAMGSYKAVEESSLEFQRDLPEELRRTPEQILEVPMAPDVDTPLYIKWAESQGHKEEIHQIELRKLDTLAYNKGKKVEDRRIVHYFKSHYPLSPEPNLHIAALLHTSDRNSLFTILNVQDPPDKNMIRNIASIDHAFVMHDLKPLVDKEWMTMETWTDRATDNRGLYKGRMYDADGRLIASFMQDGVVRILTNKSNL